MLIKQKAVLTAFFFLLSLAAWSQTRTVKGVVSEEESGAPLPGATVSIVGTTRGVITDLDGTFELSGVKPTDKLVFDFYGKESQIVTVGQSTQFIVKMKDATSQLDEVTVVAFGKQKKESVIRQHGQTGGTESPVQ